MDIRNPSQPRAFTLIELVVVSAIMAMLAAVLLPSLAGARQQARIVKVHSDLRQISVALDGYQLNNRDLPPTRAGCDSNIFYQLPIELFHKRWLPKRPGSVPQIDFEDEFNPGHTYHYKAPGPMLLNSGGSGFTIQEKGSYLFVPDDYPKCKSDQGEHYNDRKKSPVQYAVYSMGPDPRSAKFPRTGVDAIEHYWFPLKAGHWCMNSGDTGIIAHSKDKNDFHHMTP